MKIVIDFPPNIDELKKHFGIGYTVVFTYGDILYNPGNGLINNALMVHEETHSRQQKMIGVEYWWAKYIKDPKFRTEQEIEAYQNQYQEYKRSHTYRQSELFLNNIARDLSGSLYGNVISFQEALTRIRNNNKI